MKYSVKVVLSEVIYRMDVFHPFSLYLGLLNGGSGWLGALLGGTTLGPACASTSLALSWHCCLQHNQPKCNCKQQQLTRVWFAVKVCCRGGGGSE